MQNFSQRTQKKRDYVGGEGIIVRIILKWILLEKCGTVDWIHLREDSLQWYAITNIVIMFRVIK
jgi:hypothetical protein